MVDVRDAATAFARAVTADVLGEILLVGGDDSHKLRQGEVGPSLATARGMTDVLPSGRIGDPHGEDKWFVTEWMDTSRAQEALDFQHHSWQDMEVEMRDNAGWTRPLMRLIAPIARTYTKRKGAYLSTDVEHACPWAAIRQELGEPGPDSEAFSP